MQRASIELIRPNGLVERLDRPAPLVPARYARAPSPVDRRRGTRWPDALWRGRLVDLLS